MIYAYRPDVSPYLKRRLRSLSEVEEELRERRRAARTENQASRWGLSDPMLERLTWLTQKQS